MSKISLDPWISVSFSERKHLLYLPLGQEICVVQVIRPTLNFTPTLTYFLQILKLIFSKFSSWKRISEQNTCMYQKEHLKRKSKFLCIQSLVLEAKGQKKCYILKKIDLNISGLSYLINFEADLNIKKKK